MVRHFRFSFHRGSPQLHISVHMFLLDISINILTQFPHIDRVSSNWLSLMIVLIILMSLRLLDQIVNTKQMVSRSFYQEI